MLPFFFLVENFSPQKSKLCPQMSRPNEALHAEVQNFYRFCHSVHLVSCSEDLRKTSVDVFLLNFCLLFVEANFHVPKK